MTAGHPEWQIDLFPDDAGVAVSCLQRQRMKGKFRELSKDPLEITVIFPVREKNPPDVGKGLRHGKQDLPQVGFRSPYLSGNEKERVHPDSHRGPFFPLETAMSV